MSFLLSLFLLSWFPACWASCHFHCAGFSLHSASTELSFCCVWPPHHRGRAEVVSARLNLNHGTRDVRGVCNFLSSVSPQQSVTAWLQLSFIKQRIVHPWGVRAVWPKRRGLNPSWLFSFIYLSPPRSWACPMQIELVKKGSCLFHLKFSLQSEDFLLFHFHGLFPLFVFLPPPFWTPFPILTT